MYENLIKKLITNLHFNEALVPSNEADLIYPKVLEEMKEIKITEQILSKIELGDKTLKNMFIDLIIKPVMIKYYEQNKPESFILNYLKSI